MAFRCAAAAAVVVIRRMTPAGTVLMDSCLLLSSSLPVRWRDSHYPERGESDDEDDDGEGYQEPEARYAPLLQLPHWMGLVERPGDGSVVGEGGKQTAVSVRPQMRITTMRRAAAALKVEVGSEKKTVTMTTPSPARPCFVVAHQKKQQSSSPLASPVTWMTGRLPHCYCCCDEQWR